MTIATVLMLASTPVHARVTSNFGVRSDPFTHHGRMHQGMDMAAPQGTYVYATGDAWVVRGRWASGYGNLVELAHGHGYVTRFGHLSQIVVREGQYVHRGEMIGRVGTTGRSTGPHLHYEVRINGKAVNPAPYMQIVFATPPDRSVLDQARLMQASEMHGHRGGDQPPSTGRARGTITLVQAHDKWRDVSDYSALAEGHVSAQ